MLIHSIRTKILIIVLVFLFIIGSAFVFYSINTTINYKNLRLEGIEKTINYEIEKVNKIIAELERGAVFYAVGGFFYYIQQSDEFGENFAVESLKSLPEAIGGGFWFEPYTYNHDKLRSGFYAFFDKELEKVRIDDTFYMDEYDYHNKSWYREIIENIKNPYQVIWTMPYIDDSGTFSLMITAGAGIFEDEKLIALTTVDWEIDNIIEQLLEINPTQNSIVLLYIPENDLIISTTYENILTGSSIKNLPWDINDTSFKLNNINYIKFGRFMDNNWRIAIYIPENEIFAEVEKRNTRYSIIIAIASVVILLTGFFFISAFVNKPIKKLSAYITQIATGNLDTKINIKTKDEIGLLAETFRNMTSDLKKSIEENMREREEKKRINTELEIASGIQASMLPQKFPPFPDRDEFNIFASMVPARNVGGDFYDFYFIDKHNLAIIIADVSGKGIPAALFMVNTKTLIKNCSKCKSPKTAFESINNKLYENNEACIFVTAFMGFYNTQTGLFKYVNAGHNPPLRKKKSGTFEYLKTKPYIALGIIKDAVYKEEEIKLEKGDTLFLYTDGVTEAMNSNNELFNEIRLLDALNKNKEALPSKLVSEIKKEVDFFSNGIEQTDDIAMLALRINIDENELSIPANKKNLDKVIGFINGELDKLKLSSILQNEIDIAVEEIFVNIVDYAYQDTNGDVIITISTNENINIKFEDTGRQYNPLEQPEPDFTKPLTDRNIGGLGIFMVKKIMDTVEYTRLDNKNILKIVKNHP
ncbi:MAG: SpoIIE family protein phosphatase [Treponema sp.]|nr:SpoIIE family protein phosphatase [Treponema sp.]